MSDNQRQPKNLQSLLKFCLNADDGGSLQGNGIDPAEAAEKGEWLRKVMAENFVNMGDKTRENMECLYKVIETNEISEGAIFALEELQDITEHIEFAKDFIKMGGLNMIKNLLDLTHEVIVIESSQLLGNTIQNDEFCQSSAINAGFIELLIAKISNCYNGKIVKSLVYALSCCVRGSQEGIKIYKLASGTKVLLESMNKGNQEAAIKISFLLSCLVKDCDLIESLFTEDDFKQLIQKTLEYSEISETIEFLAEIIVIALKQKSKFTVFIDSSVVSWSKEHLEKSRKEDFDNLFSQLSYIIDMAHK